MPLPDDLRMRLAAEGDLPAIAALRDSVGWAAHDWALRAVLLPPDARCLVVVDSSERMVGIGSGISYGAFGFVGNMIVADDQRRRGVGSAILEAVIAFLEERGCTRLELFATQSGRPLYARHGFELTDPTVMVDVPRSTPLVGEPDVKIRQGAELGELAGYDRPRFAGDRRGLLAMILSDEQRPLLVAHRDGAIVGYLWLRPDGPRVGPFIADTPPVAAALLAEAFARLPAAERLALHLPTLNVPATRWLAELGIAVDPRDGRMARGPEIARRHDTIYANMVGALG